MRHKKNKKILFENLISFFKFLNPHGVVCTDKTMCSRYHGGTCYFICSVWSPTLRPYEYAVIVNQMSGCVLYDCVPWMPTGSVCAVCVCGGGGGGGGGGAHLGVRG